MGSDDITLRVKDFTLLPGARTKEDGDGSAEEFFERFIRPSITNNKNLTIDFDGTWGYASSFLSQLAKYLVSFYGGYDNARVHVGFISNDEPGLQQRFLEYMAEAGKKDERG